LRTLFARPLALVVATWLVVPVYGLQAPDPPRFRVGVDAVRIDAVVTDRDGRIVTDLTAGDFDVRQDGKRQTVTFAEFMPVSGGADPAPGPGVRVPRGASPLQPDLFPAPALKREEVQRTFTLVVDDLGLSVESLQNARRALHTFVDRSLRPTDLAAIVRTGGSTSALQSFTTDRRVLHSAIDALRFNGSSRSGVEAFDPVNLNAGADSHSTLSDPTDFSAVDRLRRSMLTAGTLGALNLVVRGARDLPGRRAIVLVSEGFQMVGADLTGPQSGASNSLQPEARVRAARDRLVDQAARAGVVIYALDCRGLQTAGLQASDAINVPPNGTTMEETVRTKAADRLGFNRDTQEGLRYVAEQTGGFAVLNNNDLAAGLGRIADDVRGYYVIGYAPREGTFAAKGQRPSVHKIAVTVSRPGLRVKTRKAFLGVSDPGDEAVASLSPAEELVRAATSPFTASGISLRATTLPGYSPADGAFVRALLHVDARGLTFGDGPAGKKTAAADVLGMVFDQEGLEVAHLSTGFSIARADDAADAALSDGVAYTLQIPIRRPGGYQVRFAIRDQRSGALGSAGEFVDIANMAGGEFALSGIVLHADDGGAATSAGLDRLTLTPAQALRVFTSGSGLSYAYEIYNASGSVQSAPSIWRGIEPVFRPQPDTLKVPAGREKRFAAAGKLKLGALVPGAYVLQITAVTNDASRSARKQTATQRIAFDVK
jgi:VWFA-related protein